MRAPLGDARGSLGAVAALTASVHRQMLPAHGRAFSTWKTAKPWLPRKPGSSNRGRDRRRHRVQPSGGALVGGHDSVLAPRQFFVDQVVLFHELPDVIATLSIDRVVQQECTDGRKNRLRRSNIVDVTVLNCASNAPRHCSTNCTCSSRAARAASGSRRERRALRCPGD